jgi:hypothetical protein
LIVALTSLKSGCCDSLPPAHEVPTVMPPQSTVALVMTLPGLQLLGGTVELDALEELFDDETLDFDEELLAGGLLLEDLLDETLLAELVEVPLGTEHSLVPPATRPPKVASLQVKLPASVL